MNKAEVFRKAAEIIVRDGKCEGELVAGYDEVLIEETEAIKHRVFPVCALGACARAEYELYGTLPLNHNGTALDPYGPYKFSVTNPGSKLGRPISILRLQRPPRNLRRGHRPLAEAARRGHRR